MSRHPRVHAEGLLYYATARRNDGQKIFLGESDCQAFLEGAVYRAPTLPVLPLRVCLDAESLEFIIGGSSFSTRASAVAF